jgi:hypothetical protein
MSQSDKQDKQVILMSVPRAPVAPRRFDFRQVSLYIVFRCIAASAMQLFYNYFISKYRSTWLIIIYRPPEFFLTLT